MISDKRLFVLTVAFALLLGASGASGTTPLEFPDFVITSEKFQRILWREFLIEFPNIYSKRCHRIYDSGTVVFHDADGSPTLSFFATQEFEKLKDGLVSRLSRLYMRSPSGQELVDITVNDVGRDLQETLFDELLMGRLPLDLGESALREKSILIAGLEGADVAMEFLIRPGEAGDSATVLSVVADSSNLFRIGEIQNHDSREVSWSIESGKRLKGTHTLRAKKIRTEWMLFGSEEFYVDGREHSPAGYQAHFSEFGVQGLIVDFQEMLKGVVEFAICYPDCKRDAGDRNQK